MEKQKNFLNAVLENLEDTVAACDEAGNLTVITRDKATGNRGDMDNNLAVEDWRQETRIYYADGKTEVPPDQVPNLRALRGERLKNEQIMVHNQLGITTVLVSGRALIDQAGATIGAVLTSHDVTEERRAKAQADATMQNLIRLIEICPVGIMLMDPAFKITMWNQGCETIYGWTKEEVLGENLPFIQDSHESQSKWMRDEVIRTREKVEM